MESAPVGNNATPADMLEQLLCERHSCRAFMAEPVNDQVIERILMLAQRTPSWCNTQPWKVIVTRGAGTEAFRTTLSERVCISHSQPDIQFPLEYHGIYKDRRRSCGFQLYDAVGIAHGDREASNRQALENFRFFGAPHVAIVTVDAALRTYGAVDCGAYVTTFMLAAAALGVASIAQASLASYSSFIREYFGIPGDRLILCGISFGYEDQTHPVNAFRTQRAPQTEVVEWWD